MPARFMSNQSVKEFFAEFLGTAILMIFGIGSVAQYVLSNGQTGTSDQIRWSWGLGVTFGIYVSGGVSGGHLNPAVTLTLVIFRRLSWRKLLPYCLGQYLGSFVAACLLYLVYYDAFESYNNGAYTFETATVFATYPQSYLGVVNGLWDQVFGTAVLMLLVLALTDEKNMAPTKGYLPIVVGLIVVAIGMTLGHNCGYAINPARDLAPRIFTAIAGWGTQVFSFNDYKWFWIPVIGPHIGAILGGAVYEACINQRLAVCCRSNEQADTEDIAVGQVEAPRGVDNPTCNAAGNAIYETKHENTSL